MINSYNPYCAVVKAIINKNTIEIKTHNFFQKKKPFLKLAILESRVSAFLPTSNAIFLVGF